MSSITTDNDGNNNMENVNNKYVNIIKGKYSEEAKIATLAALEAGHFALEGQKQAKANVSVNNNNDSYSSEINGNNKNDKSSSKKKKRSKRKKKSRSAEKRKLQVKIFQLH